MSPIHEAMLTVLPTPLLRKGFACECEVQHKLGVAKMLQSLWSHPLSTSMVASHPDSFLVKLVCSHPSPLVDDLLVKLSVTQDTNRLRVSDNMVIWWGEDSLSEHCSILYNTPFPNHPHL